jgi:mRNA-degrading endonuclease toxin of MazEF toxin-antitoxin module
MVVNQRDVLLLSHSFDSDKPHPFIILSVNEANEQEKTFVAVMITSSEKTRDDFSFELSNEMFLSPLSKDNSHVRMHLITSSFNNCIIQKINTMKIYPFNQLMRSIGDLIFNFDFIPLKS